MADGRFTEARMRTAVAGIASQLGVSAKDAEILYMGNNAVFALPEAGLVVRITRSNRLEDRVRKVARLGAWFAEIDAPTIRPAGAAPQPLAFEDLLATVWEYVPPAAPMDIDDLARALREFHALPVPDVGLEQWDPVGIARKRIADAHALEDTDRTVLLDWCDRLEPDVDALVKGSAHTMVHGDAHIGNLLRRPDGRVVFCDFDSTCLGPPGVDLSAVAAAEIWFARDGRHARLAAAYGRDITRDPSWPLLRQARELAYVVGGVPLMGSTPGVSEQFRLRLDSVMSGDTSVRWTPYAAFGRTDR